MRRPTASGAVRADEMKLACPLTSGAVANVVVPSLKVTVPLGVPAPGPWR